MDSVTLLQTLDPSAILSVLPWLLGSGGLLGGIGIGLRSYGKVRRDLESIRGDMITRAEFRAFSDDLVDRLGAVAIRQEDKANGKVKALEERTRAIELHCRSMHPQGKAGKP